MLTVPILRDLINVNVNLALLEAAIFVLVSISLHISLIIHVYYVNLNRTDFVKLDCSIMSTWSLKSGITIDKQIGISSSNPVCIYLYVLYTDREMTRSPKNFWFLIILFLYCLNSVESRISESECSSTFMAVWCLFDTYDLLAHHHYPLFLPKRTDDECWEHITLTSRMWTLS